MPQDPNQLPDDELPYEPTPEQIKQKTKESQAGLLGSLKEQVSLAEAAPGEIAKQEQQALAGAREKSGRAFAAQLAQGGGGSLAGMRQSQLSRGIAEGQLMGEYGMQKIAAQRLAAQAKGELATEKQKLLQAGADRERAQAKEAEDITKKIREDFQIAKDAEKWWSADDAKAFAQRIRDQYKSHPNQKVRDEANRIAGQIEAQETSWYDPTSWFGAGKGEWAE